MASNIQAHKMPLTYDSQAAAQVIKDRLQGVSFSFLTDEEILKLSVVEVKNTQTFDTLNNPVAHGLHDKRMGVSPFDRNASCPTCGLTSNGCPGHHGHIKLVAPIFNPFMIKDMYRLMKAKCFSCHNLRIPEQKINTFVIALKLIKVGQIVESARVKSYFLNLARDVINIQDTPENEKRAAKAFETLNKLADAKLLATKKRDMTQLDLKMIQRRVNLEREKFENEVHQLIDDVEERKPESNNLEISGPTSIVQKYYLEIMKEIWSSVITTKCPRCKKNSPAFRKDGYTKMFVKPLTGRNKNAQDQKDKLDSESQTVGSTTHMTSKRGTSTVADDEEFSEDVEEEMEERGLVDEAEVDEDEEYKEGSAQKYISPAEIQDHIMKLWNRQDFLLDLMYGKIDASADEKTLEVASLGPQMFFLNYVVVPPTRFRPESEGAMGGRGGGGDKAYLHTHSAMLLKILQTNHAMKDALLDQSRSEEDPKKGNRQGKLGVTTQKWIQLQEAANCFMDSSMASKNADKEQGGVRQLLEKKEGMFRMKMMGKRVNYGGRSVISPDPYITTDQIGVPVFMAKRLTFPESVSSFNAERLRQAVRNGTKAHPGANMVEDEETGQQIHLEYLNDEQREGIANLLNVGRKVVYRHLLTGDPLLVNRQPTLHKPSIMAHSCRVLPKEQTIRMHYANCSAYNADFDGDEMNIHLPQSYQAIAEANGIMATHRQYCVPTSGKPLRGLIQDSVVAGVHMTGKDTFLSKEQYNQLVYIGLRELIETDKIGKIITLPPTILKPKPFWTGKQVISTLLKNIVNREKEYAAKNLTGLNVSFKSKLNAKEWGPLGTEEGDVVFRDNEHLRGTLDKSAFGATDYGLVHAFYEVYGSQKAGELLTSLARVFTIFLQQYGFTCGLDDLMIDRSFNKKRRMAIEEGLRQGMKGVSEFCGVEGFDPKKMNYSNRVVKQSKKHFDADFDEFNKMSLPKNPLKKKNCILKNDELRVKLDHKMSTAGTDLDFLDNELDNIMQGKMNEATSSVLKEIIPSGLVKKFPSNNLSAMVMTGAKGGVVNQTQISALLGQQSLEGRRVPKMQNGKTLPCYLPYDPNPRSSGYISDRFLTGLRPQDFYFHCMAGREGLIDTAVKTSRSGYLQRCLIKQLESLIVNYDMTVRDNDGSIVQFMYGEDGIDVTHNKYLERFDFLESNFNSLLSSGMDLVSRIDTKTVPEYQEKIRKKAKLLKKQQDLSSKEALQAASDPILSLFHPQKYFGSISEKMAQNVNNYMKKECQSVKLDILGSDALPRKYQPIKPETFQQMYYMKYIKSLIHPGENVGTVAAQSVGEPSTQMTLNTFHLAGHGAGNMTLGIPRLKEILMTTPYNIKTPIMKLYFRKDAQLSIDQCQKFANKFQKLKMSDIVKEIKVHQSISQTIASGFQRVYEVQVRFDNRKALKKNLGIDSKRLAKMFSDFFIPQLMGDIFKQLRKGAADDIGSTVLLANTDVAKATTSKQKIPTVNKKGDAEMGGDDEDINEKKEGTTAFEDEDDEMSDDEKEQLQEVNEIDGVVKIKKDFRGYESDNQGESDNMSSISAPRAAKKRANSETSGVEKYTKPLRETHSKYLQFLKEIKFDEHENVSSVKIAFPLDFKKILMLTVAEQTLSKVLVRSVRHIEKCTLIKPKKPEEEPVLIVQGINFEAFYPHQDVIDVNRIETNHSYALSSKYGVEAMRANIMKEIQMVFGVYGISVDRRHLSLITDFMTFNGEYRAFNRIGMEESSSPFLKMSYETTMKYLVGAAQNQEKDDMSTPSSAIVLGQVPRVGTNIFDILCKQ